MATWEGRVEWRRSLGNLLRVPWLYAAGGALLSRWVGFPEALSAATGLLAGGAIPLFLLLLGLELAQVRLAQVARPALGLALVRLLASGGLAWALASALGTAGPLRGSLILEGSVPSAVNAFLLASQFNRRPDLAAAVLLLSTLLSLGTLSLTLFLLRSCG